MQKYQKTFGLVAIFLLLGSVLTIAISPANATPLKTNPTVIGNSITHYLGDEWNGLSWHNQMTPSALLKKVYKDSQVYYPKTWKPTQIREALKDPNNGYFCIVKSKPSIGDFRIYGKKSSLKDQIAIHYEQAGIKWLVIVDKDLGVIRVKPNKYPYNKDFTDVQYIKLHPHWEL